MIKKQVFCRNSEDVFSIHQPRHSHDEDDDGDDGGRRYQVFRIKSSLMDVMMMLALYTHQKQQQHNGIKRLGHNEKERKKFERKEQKKKALFFLCGLWEETHVLKVVGSNPNIVCQIDIFH